MSEQPPAAMTSQRPYLLRALHEWIGDNGLTPHLLVNAHHAGVHVPPHTVKDGQVVLNIAERAVNLLSMGNEYITFNARFGGVRHEVFVPVSAVLAIYARETGQGMALPEDMADSRSEAASADPALAQPERSPPTAAPEAPGLASVPKHSDDDNEGDDPSPPEAPPPPRRGHLRVVK